MARYDDPRGGRGSNQYSRKPRDPLADPRYARSEAVRGIPPPKLSGAPSRSSSAVDVDVLTSDDPSVDVGGAPGAIPDGYLEACVDPRHPSHVAVRDDAVGEKVLTDEELALALAAPNQPTDSDRMSAMIVVADRGSQPRGATLRGINSLRFEMNHRAVGAMGLI